LLLLHPKEMGRVAHSLTAALRVTHSPGATVWLMGWRMNVGFTKRIMSAGSLRSAAHGVADQDSEGAILAGLKVRQRQHLIGGARHVHSVAPPLIPERLGAAGDHSQGRVGAGPTRETNRL
jgi:hypothetical protein